VQSGIIFGEASVNFYQNTRRHIPGDSSHSHDNIKSQSSTLFTPRSSTLFRTDCTADPTIIDINVILKPVILTKCGYYFQMLKDPLSTAEITWLQAKRRNEWLRHTEVNWKEIKVKLSPC
jgi:hypothetical protein